MKKTAAAAVSSWLVILLLTAAALAAGDAPRLTDADNGREITLAAGAVTHVTLLANAGTGYVWQVVSSDAGVVEVGKHDVKVDHAPGLVGGPIHYVFPLTAKKPGRATLTATFFRPWEKDTPPAKTVTINVVVGE